MRDDGFYWVLFCDEWQVAQWRLKRKIFLIPGIEQDISESEVNEIDERRVYREPILKSYDMKCSCGRTLHQHTYCQICDNDE